MNRLNGVSKELKLSVIITLNLLLYIINYNNSKALSFISAMVIVVSIYKLSDVPIKYKI